jgi:hypothetical protein
MAGRKELTRSFPVGMISDTTAVTTLIKLELLRSVGEA